MIDFDVVTGPNPSEQPEKTKPQSPTRAGPRTPTDGSATDSALPNGPLGDDRGLSEIPKR
jgi:hypothetical protein